MLVTERNVAGCLERIDRSRRLVMDTETTGLGVFTGDRMCGVAVKAEGDGDPRDWKSDDDRRFYFPFRHGEGPNLSDQRRKQLVQAMTGKELGGFHLRFDLEVMHNEGLPPPPKIEDTLIAALLMNENESTFALKRSKRGEPGLSVKYLGKESIAASERLDELLQQKGLSKHEMWKLSGADVAEYACADLDLPEALLERVYRPAMDRWGISDLFAEYNVYQQLLVDMEIGGLPTDRTIIDRALAEGETARAELLREIQEAAGYPLNPASWKQVSAWLGTPNAQESTILASKHPFADKLIDFKAYGKRDSTYLKRFIDYADANGILHLSINLTPDESDEGGTRSGRLSCSRPNLQAMPKPSTNEIYAACRRSIVAPPGYSILEADWSQAEVRIAAHYSQEPALFALFETGADPYLDLVAEIQPICPWFKRQDAKILHLAIQYGAGIWKVAQMLGIDKDTASKLRAAWQRRFPRIKRIMYRLQDMAEQKGSIKLYDGRWVHFDGATKGAGCKSPYYTAWNRLVQGTVANMGRQAMLRIRQPLAELGGRMLLQIHDSVLSLVRTDRLAESVAVHRAAMEDFPQWDVPAKIDVKVGPNWLDLEPYKEAA